MFFGVFLIGVVMYGIWQNMDEQAKPSVYDRVTKFKDAYFPVETGILDHIQRNVPFGFVPGKPFGKLSYQNPKRFVTVGEFNSKLNEGQWGYAAGLRNRAINTENYQRLIDDQFNFEEHPRLDSTRLSMCVGRHRRPQYAFVDKTQ